MGNQQSNENDKAGGWVGDNFEEGYHILKVQKNSPGERAGLVAFFDFIVAADSVPVSSEQASGPQGDTSAKGTSLVEKLKAAAEKKTSVRLQLYNSKEDQVRETFIEPTSEWGGNGLIGVSIRLCSLRAANEFVWHVLEVYENSPASKAGLVAFGDYIVGTPSLLFSSSEDFYTLIRSNQGRETELYVYNLNSDDIRVVSIAPDPNWGGDGSLGCNVGFGLLHRVPTKANIAAARALGGELDALRPSAAAAGQQQQRGVATTTAAATAATATTRTPTTPQRPAVASGASPATPMSPEQMVIQDRLEAARLARLRAEQEELELASQLQQLALVQQGAASDSAVVDASAATITGDDGARAAAGDDAEIVDLQEIDLQQQESQDEHCQPQSLAELRQTLALDDDDDDDDDEEDGKVQVAADVVTMSPPRTQPPIATPPASPASLGDSTASPLATSGASTLEALAQRRRDLAARLAQLREEPSTD
jgi:GRASP55/65 PDZ-like domain